MMPWELAERDPTTVRSGDKVRYCQLNESFNLVQFDAVVYFVAAPGVVHLRLLQRDRAEAEGMDLCYRDVAFSDWESDGCWTWADR